MEGKNVSKSDQKTEVLLTAIAREETQNIWKNMHIHLKSYQKSHLSVMIPRLKVEHVNGFKTCEAKQKKNV